MLQCTYIFVKVVCSYIQFFLNPERVKKKKEVEEEKKTVDQVSVIVKLFYDPTKFWLVSIQTHYTQSQTGFNSSSVGIDAHGTDPLRQKTLLSGLLLTFLAV